MSQSSALRTPPPRAAAAAGADAGVGAAARATAPVLLAIFIATLVIPVSVYLAGLRLTPIRLVLLVSFVPLVGWMLMGRAGRLNLVDLFMGLFSLWLVISLLATEGLDRFDFVGISTVELSGGYLIGRCFVRNTTDFRLLWKLHFLTLAFLLPFVLVDHFTGRQLWAEILDVIGDVPYRSGSSRPRMGLERVITGFDHPILYGLYCSIGAVVGFYVMRDRLVPATARLGFVTWMTFMSLSSGALLSVMIQVQLMTWDWLTKGRWKLLSGLAVSAYVLLDLASDRGPILLFIETFTFSPGNAWTRIHQWNYGTAEVMRHPILGLGLTGDWERPSWLYSSIDNFWLAAAMRHGLPGVSFLILAIVFLTLRTVRARDLPPLVRRYRTGYMITLVGICFTLGTVHIWGAVAVFVMFYLGAGVWIADAAGAEADDADEAATAGGDGPKPGRLPLRRSFSGAKPQAAPPRPAPSRPAPGRPVTANLRRDRVPPPGPRPDRSR